MNSIHDLLDVYANRPILVIGGGPSVSVDLPKLKASGFEPACVISANDHGLHQDFYPVDFVVNADKRHCEKRIPMQQYLDEIPVPEFHAGWQGKTINRHSWATYRLLDWPFTGNSGLTALAVAVTLGPSVAVVTGIDCWETGRRYFHDGPPGRIPVNFREERVRKVPRFKHTVGAKAVRKFPGLVEFCRGVKVRAMSGPLVEQFSPYGLNYKGADLVFDHELGGNSYSKHLKKIKTLRVRAASSFEFQIGHGDRVREGQEFIMSSREYERTSQKHKDARLVVLSGVSGPD